MIDRSSFIGGACDELNFVHRDSASYFNGDESR